MTDRRTPTELLEHWARRQRSNQLSHYHMAEVAGRRAFWFSVTSATISGVVGFLILIAVRYDPPLWLRLALGCLSILGAVVAAVAASAKWGDKATQHHAAGAAYGAVLRRIQEALAVPPESDEAMRSLLQELRKEIDAVPMKAPPIPDRVWRRMRTKLTPEDERQSLLLPSGESRV
jgi:hypothetical protein